MRGYHRGWAKVATTLSAAAFLVSTLLQAQPAHAASVTATVNYTVLASSNSSGAAGSAASHTPAVSANGLYVAFISDGPLVATDTNGFPDVYRKYLGDNSIQLVSINAAGTAAGNASSAAEEVAISDDGNIVVFRSDATDLVANDTNGQTDLFARNMTTGTTQQVNLSSDETISAFGPDFFSVSADGTKVAFVSYTALSGGDVVPAVYRRDLTAGTTQFIHESEGAQVAMSGDATKIAFMWNGTSDYSIYMWDQNDPVIYLINFGTSSNFADPAGLLGPDSFSDDGNILAFWSDGDAYDNVSGPHPRAVYAYNHSVRKTCNPNCPAGTSFFDITKRMSQTQAGVDGNADSGGTTNDWPKGAVSADGTKVAFTSQATNLDPAATSGGLMVKDVVSGFIKAQSLKADNQTVAPVSNSTLSANGVYAVFATAASGVTPTDTNGVSDVFVHVINTAATGTPTPANLSLTSDLSVTKPAFSKLPTEDIPATNLQLDALGQVAGAPLRSIDMAAAPLRSIPLRSIPLRSIPLRSIPLRSITLSEIPLRNGTWEAILATIPGDPFKGVPLQNITLDQALDAPGMATVSLNDVDLASTPLRSISLSSILLGATPLRSIPVGGDTTTAYADWCSLLSSMGYSCTTLGLTQDSNVLAVDLAGVPLRSIPLRSIPLRSIDLSTAPLRSIPLRSIDFLGTKLGAVRLSDLDATKRAAIVDCSLVDCANDDMGDATQANPPDTAFVAGATLGQFFDAVASTADLGTLGELVAALVDTSNYPWEDINLDGLQETAAQADLARTVTYTAAFDLNGGGTNVPTTATVDLPTGFRYVPFSTVNHDDTYPEPTVNGGHLVWSFTSNAGGTHNAIVFEAYPSFELANDTTSSFQVTAGGTVAAVQNQAPVDVVQDWEPPSAISFDCGAACFSTSDPIIDPNTLIVGHIAYAGDIDSFRLPVPPKGTRIQIRLGNHSDDADFDVAMLNTTVDAAPLRSIPLRSIPLRSIPLTDNGVDATAANSALSPETLNDISGINSTPLRSIGENRGTADEFLATVSDADVFLPPPPGTEFGSQQYYTIQVTAYNGGHSNSPYVLYVKEYEPPPAPACPSPKVYAHPTDNAVGAAPGSLPSNLNTLILVDKKRMGMTYGATARDDVLAKLGQLAGASSKGVTGVVYPVDGDSTAGAALDNWDLDPCSPDAANAAFNAIGEIVDSVRAQRPTLKYIVIAGGDDILPMARVADYTQISNESDYAAETLLTAGTHRGTPIAAAEATQNILTDDPLGDVDPLPWLDHQLYVPDLAVGRLVETPTDIIGQVDQFLASTDGTLNPQKSLTMGYDFLADGAQSVDAALGNRLPAANRTAIVNETWSKADALAALFPSGSTPPDVVSVNAHYDHGRALPALGNSTDDLSDLITTDDIAAHPNTLNKRLIFTMGCHAGLSVPASYTDTEAKDKDWAQQYLGTSEKAAVYFANTGFGYGDTAAVALSEELMRQFAQRLDGTMSVGEAAVYAKQAYFGQLGAYGPYDEKAMQEATFYGLPMWKVAGGTVKAAAAPSSGITPTPDPAAPGVSTAPLTVSSSFTKKTSKGGGTYFTAAAANAAATGLQVTQYRPIEPRLSVDVTPTDGSQAHGVLISDLTSHDEPVVPAMARPVIDLTANEPPPPAGDVSFPTSFDTISTFNSPQGQRQHVVFLPGQFFRDAGWSDAGGVQRLFDAIQADVKYSTSPDFVAPQLTNVQAHLDNGTLSFSLFAYDRTETGAAGQVKKVLVLVKDATGGWTPLALTDGNNDGTYDGSLAVTGTDFEYFAEAQDAAGNVGVTTNKGKYYSGVPAPLTTNGTPNLVLTPGQPTGSNGWYRSDVTVSLQGTQGVTYQKSVDGGALQPYSNTTFSADGNHSVKAVGSDGSTDTAVVVVDKTPPVITTTPDRPANANGWYNAPVKLVAACSDATSGVQVCPPTQVLSAEGADQSLTAFDFAGNSASSQKVSIDLTPPTVTVGGVVDGGDYTGVAPAPTCTVTDALSGPLGCVGSLGPAATPGYWSYVAIGKDRAGNTTTKTVTFKATYVFGGFLQPVNDTAHDSTLGYSVFNGGATVPLKFKLRKLDGTSTQASATPTFLTPVRMGPISGIPVNETTETLGPSAGNLFTYDPASQTYSFNWKADKKAFAGYFWRVGALIDGKQFTVIIGVK